MHSTEIVTAVVESEPCTAIWHFSHFSNVNFAKIKNLPWNHWCSSESPLTQFKNWAENRLKEDDEFYRENICLDEAYFHLGGYVKSLCFCGLRLGLQRHNSLVQNPRPKIFNKKKYENISFWRLCFCRFLTKIVWEYVKILWKASQTSEYAPC